MDMQEPTGDRVCCDIEGVDIGGGEMSKSRVRRLL